MIFIFFSLASKYLKYWFDMNDLEKKTEFIQTLLNTGPNYDFNHF